MFKSENLDQLALALSKAQGAMESAKKDASNPFYKSKYADLASVWDALRKPLSENQLAVSQMMDGDVLITVLMHSSGQWIESKAPIKAKDDSPQAFGSAVTYSRRYALAAIMGVTQHDDDGEAAQRTSIQNAPVKKDYPVADHRAEPPANFKSVPNLAPRAQK